MSKQNDGGPAFPGFEHNPEDPEEVVYIKGMSTRLYIATQAMRGLIDKKIHGNYKVEDQAYQRQVAAVSFEMADAMLKASEK